MLYKTQTHTIPSAKLGTQGEKHAERARQTNNLSLFRLSISNVVIEIAWTQSSVRVQGA